MAEQKENELYAKWLEADAANRDDIEARLCAAVKRHGQAVLSKELGETPPDLVDKITIAVMTQLRKFRRQCKFSTWVQEIAQRKAKEHIRGLLRARKVFDEYMTVAEDHPDDFLKPRAGTIVPSVSPHLEGEIAVKEILESLPEEDGTVLRHKLNGLKSKEIAEAMGTTVEAVDSRVARLKPRLKNRRFIRRK